MKLVRPLRLSVEVERWAYRAPFRITGHVREAIDVVVVSLQRDGCIGRGEAAGVRYRKDHADFMVQQIEARRSSLEADIDRETLQELLPPGGARNAVDCALWDLEAKLLGRPVWQMAGLEAPHPVLTVFTCGADSPEQMALKAQEYAQARAIKLKLTGEAMDVDRVRAVRAARPDAWLSVDANQGFTLECFERLMPALVDARVALIEQPFPIGAEALLDGFDSPIPIAADESVQGFAGIPALIGRFQAINIKLDKCGGLTEGLAMAHEARARGLEPMVGNMGNTSLAMAPAFLVGQLCNLPADLDGPLFLNSDRTVTVRYCDGFITCPLELWGGPTSAPPAE
jgi:L-Ala-D/L-Glu epimerase